MNIEISTDKARLQKEVIHDYLCNHSYWAKGIPMSVVETFIENSITFGVYENNKQIGFARVITDKAVFAYLADVFILEEYRGQGLSKKLVEYIVQYPDLQGLRRFLLLTQDAHELYRKFGFTEIDTPEMFMQIKPQNPYSLPSV